MPASVEARSFASNRSSVLLMAAERVRLARADRPARSMFVRERGEMAAESAEQISDCLLVIGVFGRCFSGSVMVGGVGAGPGLVPK